MAGAREIEVKYRVPDVNALEAALASRGLVLSPPLRQEDQAYAEAGWTYGMSKVGVTFARLRTQNGRHLLTLKRPVDNELDCEEYECEILDRARVHEVLVASGFSPTVGINKTRRTATSGSLSLCLDEVEGAGTFVEVERMAEDHESGARIQAELDHFAQALGPALERTTQTYDSLVRTPNTVQV